MFKPKYTLTRSHPGLEIAIQGPGRFIIIGCDCRHHHYLSARRRHGGLPHWEVRVAVPMPNKRHEIESPRLKYKTCKLNIRVLIKQLHTFNQFLASSSLSQWLHLLRISCPRPARPLATTSLCLSRPRIMSTCGLSMFEEALVHFLQVEQHHLNCTPLTCLRWPSRVPKITSSLM